MSNETNKALTRRFYEQVLNGRRVGVLDEIAAAGYDEHDPLPGQGEGREGLKHRVTMLVEGLAPTFTVEDLVAEGDRVVVRWTNSGRHVGDFLGAPPTDRPYAIAGIDIYRVEDGRLAEHWHVVDQLSMLQQLGMLPTPEVTAG
jgi:predicted SnoaL-like aldol condensation-catalyzing enzyme